MIRKYKTKGDIIMNGDRYDIISKLISKIIQVWILMGLLVLPVLAQINPLHETDRQVMASASDLLQNIKTNQDIAASTVLNKVITFDLKEATLVEALYEIASQADLKLSYSTQFVPLDKKLTMSLSQVTVHDALWKVLEGTGLRFAVSANGHLVLMKRQELELKTVPSQDFLVEGTVTTAEDGSTMPGVTVVEVGTQRGTITDSEGNYSLNVSGPDATLRFSFVGFQPLEVNVGGRSQINVTIEPAVETLEEVVVTALGLERDRKAIGYSITQVETQDLVVGTEGNVANLLQGQVAGVIIESTAGGIGSSSNVRIRGVSNIAGDNQPLYVVDGVPIDNRVMTGNRGGTNEQSGYVGRWGGASDGGDGIMSLNPADIESFTVLRGASAAVLYGERAQHGVILIETKRGSAGRVQVNFSNTTTLEQLSTSHLDIQTEYGQGEDGVRPRDADEAGETMRDSWGERFDGEPVIQMDGQMYPYEDLGHPGKSGFFRTGVHLRNDLSVSGGGGTATYYFSASNLSQTGIYPTANLGRTSLTARATATIGRLSADVKANYITEEVNNRPSLGFGGNNAIQAILDLARNVPQEVLQKNVYEEDGFSQFVLPSGGTFQGNPYWLKNELGQKDARDRLIGHLKLDLRLTDWLILTGRTGVDTYNQRRTDWLGKGNARSPGGGLGEATQLVTELNSELFLAGIYQPLPSISVDGLLGTALRNSQSEKMGFRASNYIFPRLNKVQNMQDVTPVYDFSEKEVRSVYGSLNLGYNDYLFLNLTGRNDWSSTLPVQNNSFFYPSIGASFVFSEAFAPVFPEWLSFGQLRATWAEVGSDTGPYQLALDYEIEPVAFRGTQMAEIGQGTVPLADLKPSLTQEVEFGADIRFFDDRLGFDVAWYDRQAINQILSADISDFSGYGGRRLNAGRLDNTGFEMQITGVPVARPDFLWQVTANYSRNKNILVELVEGTDQLSLFRARNNVRVVAREGEEWGQIIGSPFLREPLYDSNGDLQFDEDGEIIRDPNGRIVHNNGEPVEGEDTVLGKATPDWTGGLMNTLTYRNWTLNFSVDIRWGGQFASETNRDLYNLGLHKWSLQGRAECDAAPRDSEGGWLSCYVGEGVMQARDSNDDLIFDEDGHPVYVPNTVPDTPDSYDLSNAGEAFVFDADVIYMRSIRLSYRLPSELISRVGMRGATVSIVTRNPFTIYSATPNVDPTTGMNRNDSSGIEDTGAPATRNIGFSVNLQF